MKQALKEWSITIEALGKGQIIAIWRKGGINEESFNVEQKQFVLFPTFTHQNINKIKQEFLFLYNNKQEQKNDNQIQIQYWAEVEEIIQIEKFDMLLSIASELIYTPEHLFNSWITYSNHIGKVLLLRVYAFNNPILIPNSPLYEGCKSWVELLVDIPKANTKPVLSFKDFTRKINYIKALLDNQTNIIQLAQANVPTVRPYH